METDLDCSSPTEGTLGKLASELEETMKKKLDHAAIIFTSVATKNDPHVYRVSCTLFDEVDSEILQYALDDVHPCFDAFSSGYTRGFYWRRHKRINTSPTVQEEAATPFLPFKFDDAKEPLFRVFYSGKRIVLELFHALTDGIGAMRFLKALCYRYCQLAYFDQLDEAHNSGLVGLENARKLVDGYAKSHKALQGIKGEKTPSLKKAYMIRGEQYEDKADRIRTESVLLEPLIKRVKELDTTLGAYVTAALAYAIYEEYDIDEKDTIGICVPVNLRTVFNMDTALNFFSSIVVQMPGSSLTSFNQALEETKRQLSQKASKNQIKTEVSKTVKLEDNFFSGYVPLRVKDPLLKEGYERLLFKRTSTFSNLGEVVVEEPFKQFFERFDFAGATSAEDQTRVFACSYNGKLNISFVSRLKNEGIMNRLVNVLESTSNE